ncbi:Uncharacterised protein [Mycobacteroides abscessus subsp. abscessus]|uniref:hypothetical protein n=1 Tax=Mycobacteroides abscessus TaxID=36809 RepID=UPI0009A76505|nr:hypothetical protein [Mycobacteroides abscessus]SKM35193.1 Uncharacterised protein [Mycobacteroides abscessus subsp. abscessus]
MSTYSDMVESEFFLAGRDAARSIRDEGVTVNAADAETWCPRGLHPDGEAAWLRGWRSVLA